MSEPIRVSLLINSHSFLREAGRRAVAAEKDPREWQFAVVHVAQALELTMKALLHQVHPVLVLENVDRKDRTVSWSTALSRLRNPEIGGVVVSDREAMGIKRVMDLRNRFIHSSFELRPEHAAAKFFETFAFAADFQSRHLQAEVEEIVDPDTFGALLAAEQGIREFAARALDRIEQEEVPEEFVWACPDCGNETFVAYEDVDTCYTCRFTDPVSQCPQCGEYHLESELQDFSELLDWVEGTGGRAHLHRDFGYRNRQACLGCLPRIREDIEEQRAQDDYFDSLRDEYYSRLGHMP
jgi:predicted RNA-binding Zn-ribbon protein involved in translation (DUF1610 family)